MDAKLIGILLESGTCLAAGIFLAYLGFLSPVFRRSSEQLAPDRGVGVFRTAARIVGPLLCLVAGVKSFADIRQARAIPELHWREIASTEGRFRVSAPEDFAKEVKDAPYGERRVSEFYYRALVAPLGFLVSYLDLPAEIQKTEPDAVLNKELDERVRATRVELLGKETIRFKDCPAVRFKLHDVSKGIFVEGILLLAKGRRYQLAVQYTGESSQPDREQFFNSFQVLEGP